MRTITSIAVSTILGFAGIVGVASTAQAAPAPTVKPLVDVNCYHYIYILGQKHCSYL